MVGLFLISIGTGGIKPCVVTFGGDQFPPKQVGLIVGMSVWTIFLLNLNQNQVVMN